MKFLALAAASFALAASARAAEPAPDTRARARALVARLAAQCAGAADGAPAAREPRLLMMIPAEKLDAIARDGFLNQHQTLTTNGFDRLADRFGAEQQMAHELLPYDRAGRELLPKYALLDARADGLGRYDLPTRYGEVVIVFKAAVAERATWTYADSLDFSRRAGRFDQGGYANPVFARPLNYARVPTDRNRCVNYCEAQIWGKLDLSDVDHVLVPEDAPFPASLARAGIPVYAYERTDSDGRAAKYRRGPRVISGSIEPASRVESLAPGLELDEKDARATDAELIASVSASTAPVVRRRRIGDLAARKKSPAVVAALTELFKDADPFARAQALGGLAALPDARFKPFLVAALGDADPLVAQTAIAFLPRFAGDAAVAAAAAALARELERREKVPSDDKAYGLTRDLAVARSAGLCAPSR